MVVDPDIERRIRSELLAGERLLWTGRPDSTRLLNKADIGLIPFSLLWGGFALVFFFQGLIGSTDTDAPTMLVGTVFAVIGLYFIAGRFLVKAFRRRHTWYAVTDRRVLVLTDARTRSVNAVLIRNIPAIQKDVRADARVRSGSALEAVWPRCTKTQGSSSSERCTALPRRPSCISPR